MEKFGGDEGERISFIYIYTFSYLSIRWYYWRCDTEGLE